MTPIDGVIIAIVVIIIFFFMIGSPLRLPNLRLVATFIAIGFMVFLLWKFFGPA